MYLQNGRSKVFNSTLYCIILGPGCWHFNKWRAVTLWICGLSTMGPTCQTIGRCPIVMLSAGTSTSRRSFSTNPCIRFKTNGRWQRCLCFLSHYIISNVYTSEHYSYIRVVYWHFESNVALIITFPH